MTLLVFVVIFLALGSTYILFNKVSSLDRRLDASEASVGYAQESLPTLVQPSSGSAIMKAQVGGGGT
ncbi:MAG: hypothetical protein QF535_06705 [Anaerolineales bacterium]|nr:hypothetical protein [Anaerolineales bacterium]